MAIPAKQIGWSQEENLLWEISKQLDSMNSILCPCPITTTTTSTSSTTTTTTTVFIPCRTFRIVNSTAEPQYVNGLLCDGAAYEYERPPKSNITFCALTAAGNLTITDEGPCI